MFEAIPDVVAIEDDQNEKRLTLTRKEKLNVLADQMRVLLDQYNELTIIDLPRCYLNQFHRKLDPNWYECIFYSVKLPFVPCKVNQKGSQSRRKRAHLYVL